MNGSNLHYNNKGITNTMKASKTTVLLCLIILVLLTTSCIWYDVPTPKNTGNENGNYTISLNGCIEPKYKFAYPTNLNENGQVITEEILPTFPWQFKTDLPSLPENTGSSDLFLMSQNSNGNTELWIRRILYSLGEKSTPSTSQIIVYGNGSNKWKKINSIYKGVSINNVYKQSNGQIWGIGYSSQSGGYELFKFDIQTTQFEAVANSGTIPLGRIVFDQKDALWIAKPSDAIYKYDLVEMRLSKATSIADINQLPFDKGMVLAPDGNIYILVPKREIESSQDLELIRFSTITSEIERNIPIMLAPTPTVSSLFVDHSNRIWFSDIGWMSPEKKYYQVVRSPIFLEYHQGESRNYDYYPWVITEILLESSNHLLWFRSENGLAWLEPNKGEWCWFTTLSSVDLIEDGQKTLWMIADGKLYMNKLD